MQSIDRAAFWKHSPGNWDPLHLSETFESDNAHGIPVIRDTAELPNALIEWGSKPKLLEAAKTGNTAVHFFLDDYRFESVWNHPERSLSLMQRVGYALSPDFSLWTDMPVAMQLWNVYRNRWLGRYWQAHGISVIPTISWSLPWDFCYEGVEAGSIVAISTVGVLKNKAAHGLFRDGFTKMIEVIQPRAILCYGELARVGVDSPVPVTVFPTRWTLKREAWQRRARDLVTV